tara:strand:+ start:1239 stop:1739 length:501 start_codon:yes stop_codon:yes gene_type:complete
MKSKRAGTKMVGRETIGLIIGLAIVILLVLLMYNLISPYFDKDKQTAESYFKTLEIEIGKAGQEGGGEFSMWQEEEDTKFYVVYFANRPNFNYGDITFISSGNNENHICICYVDEGKSVCDDCANLNFPATGFLSNEVGEESKVAVRGDKLKITKQEEHYLFEKIS